MQAKYALKREYQQFEPNKLFNNISGTVVLHYRPNSKS